MRISSAVIAGTFLLTACASVPKSFQYSENDLSAFVVSAIDVGKRSHNVGYSFDFVAVDMKSGLVGDEGFTISITNPGGTATDEIGRSVNSKTGLLMGAKAVAPGTYMLARMYYSYVIYTPDTTVTCLHEAAPVYTFQGGSVNLVSLPTPGVLFAPELLLARPSPTAVSEGFDIRRADYPSISARSIFVEPTTIVTFDRGSARFGLKQCAPTQVAVFTAVD